MRRLRGEWKLALCAKGCICRVCWNQKPFPQLVVTAKRIGAVPTEQSDVELLCKKCLKERYDEKRETALRSVRAQARWEAEQNARQERRLKLLAEGQLEIFD